MSNMGIERNYPQSNVCLFLSHGEYRPQREIHSFRYYCFLQKCEFLTSIPKSLISKDDWICTSCHGWLVLKHMNNDHELSLLNPHSLEKIKLPDLPSRLVVYSYTEAFVMTAPPTVSNCVLILLMNYGGNVLCWRPGQQNWTTLQLPIGYEFAQISMRTMTICNQKIYGIVASKHFVEFEIVNNSLEVTYLGRRPSNKYRKKHDRCRRGCERSDYLVGSGDDIFWIQFSNPPLDVLGSKVNSVDVFKLDSGRWIRVESIDNRVFFLNGPHSFSYTSTNCGIKTNCIHFISSTYIHHKFLYTYDMKAGNMEIDDPFPTPYKNGTKPQFILLTEKS